MNDMLKTGLVVVAGGLAIWGIVELIKSDKNKITIKADMQGLSGIIKNNARNHNLLSAF